MASTLRLPEDLEAALAAYCDQAGEGKNATVVVALRRFLDDPGGTNVPPETAPAQTADEATVEASPSKPEPAAAVDAKIAAPGLPATSSEPMQPPDWRPTSEAMRLKIITQKDRPPGFTDDEWISLSPMARAAASSRGGPLSAA